MTFFKGYHSQSDKVNKDKDVGDVQATSPLLHSFDANSFELRMCTLRGLIDVASRNCVEGKHHANLS